ncbi:MAG: leucine-rich repeat domain-containing protein [Clostridia bacterium]|nr:leucine-rich repeat domain-containing protein [Clostridia bacterium]
MATITIPDSVECIALGAFEGCTQLTTVNGAKNVKEIGTSAFKSCVSLKSIVLPNLQRMGKESFLYCKSLMDVQFPESAKIEEDAFKGSPFEEVLEERKYKALQNYWMSQGRCRRCGSRFNIFNRCKSCGHPKDY